MVKVKVCGITELQDASVAVELGADVLGFIFAPSPRRISPDEAREIISALPPFVKTMGCFVNEEPATIREIIYYCGLDLIQLHGDESPDFCQEFMPYATRALRMKDETTLRTIEQYQGKVRGLVLDTYTKRKVGGTGKTFDWELAVKVKDMGIPVILAGGLNPSNIERAISTVRPYAVDVNSGVEERPGKKSHTLLKELFEKIEKINTGG
ncbi:MAG: phosphoribosylanthranilate isomerase [Deltaproteobacteria bacterium]|nr:phosphoribosylanthranilate isomerase [Deltaproteobacteria bacterium]